MEKKKFRLATLGCRTNQYEGQAYRDQLLALGYQEAEEAEGADLCIVNTCTVTESADLSSRYQIRKLIRENPRAQVVVTGCLAERRPDLIEKIGGVARVVPNLKKEGLIGELFPDLEVPEFAITHFEAHTRAFLKVQDGCNSFCTYCIIPYVRGRSRSKTIIEAVKEARALVGSGYKEIVITGINVGDFQDGDQGLADLVRAIDGVEGIERVRISSIDPDEVDERLMDAVLEGKHCCKSLHLVLQSGSNVVLKRMNRKYTRQIFLEAVEKLKKCDPDFTFTTDVIVGFPGESDYDFRETVEVMEEVRFAKVHMFPYSRREKTRAALYPNQVAPDLLAERKRIVLERAETLSFELREAFVGRTLKVLTESCEKGFSFGHTDNFLPVKFEGFNPSNSLIEVQIVGNSADALVGIRI